MAARLRELHAEAARLDHDAIAVAALTAEEAARLWKIGTEGAHERCVTNLRRLGEHLVRALSQEATSSTLSEDTSGKPERKVLVVDDSRVAAVALSTAFSEQGFLVRSAATMPEALCELGSFEPTVLVSDVYMPKLDVEVLCSTFRSMTTGRPSLVVLISGTTGSELEARVEAIQPDAFVRKMTGTAQVLERVLALWDKL